MPLTATNLPAWVKEVGGATVLSAAEFEVLEYETAKYKLVRFVRRTDAVRGPKVADAKGDAR